MRYKFILLLILLLAFGLRLYKINNPVADWHSWRQADTAAVARNFIKFGFDPLRPRFDDLSNIPSGKDNPMGWRMVEFPLYQLVSAGSYKIFGLFSIEVWLRLITILASIGSAYFLYRIGENFVGIRFGLIAAFLFAVLPYSVYYGRAILPGSSAVFFALGSIFFFIRASWFAKRKCRLKHLFFLMVAIFAAVSLLIKPTAIFILLPLTYLAWRRYGIVKLIKSPWTYLYLFSVFAPLALWRYWIRQFPEGIPAYTWLFNGDGIRFKGAWFYWIFGERIAKLMLGYWGIVLLFIGVIAKILRKNNWFFHCLGFSALLYLIIFATGNVKHDYYQIIILPTLVFFMALGFMFLIEHSGILINKYFVLTFSCFIVFMSIALSWREVRTFYWVNNPSIVEAGKMADKLLPPDAKVIAPYGGDTAFLYQTNRQGWPIGFEIEDKIKKGATHYISVNPKDPEALFVKEKYQTIKETNNYIIIKLR